MSKIAVRNQNGGGESATRRQEGDPISSARDLRRWDPFCEMIPACEADVPRMARAFTRRDLRRSDSRGALHPQEPLVVFARRTLEERRRSLMERRQAAENAESQLLSEREPDWEDQAASESAAVGLASIADCERAQLTRVTVALERIDDGTWGICVGCGKSIAAARLRVVPEAPRCAACANHD